MTAFTARYPNLTTHTPARTAPRQDGFDVIAPDGSIVAETSTTSEAARDQLFGERAALRGRRR